MEPQVIGLLLVNALHFGVYLLVGLACWKYIRSKA